MGLMELEDLKRILIKYGDQFDEDEMELFEKSCPVSDGKVIVDGTFVKLFIFKLFANINLIFFEEFIAMLSPLSTDTGKKKKGKKGKGICLFMCLPLKYFFLI